MTGISFPSKGGPGPATPTVWFGSIVDRLNMLCPNASAFSTHLSSSGASLVPVHFANLWTLTAASLGSTTTAPDGTSTAQAIVEDTSNGNHLISSVTADPSFGQFGGVTGALRIAGYFKYNGRRIVFRVITLNDATDFNGFYVVFDLLNGQIGVPPTLQTVGSPTNATFTLLNTGFISKQPDGFYLCSADFHVNFSTGIFPGLVAQVLFDNSTGTNPISISYTGTGQGVIGWRTNMMPVGAYPVATVSFFDDFNNLSTIDVNNTLAPGYNWYINNTFNNFWSGPVQTPSAFTVSSSILTIKETVTNTLEFTIGSFGQVSPGVFVGRGWKAPALYEARMAIGFNLAAPARAIDTPFWGLSFEWFQANTINSPTNANIGILYGFEIDYGEMESAGSPPGHINVGVISGVVGSGEVLITGQDADICCGMPPYYSPSQYNGIAVTSGGLRYNSTGSVAPGNPPPATGWTQQSYAGPGNTPGQPAFPDAFVFDFTQQHTYSYLKLTYAGSVINNAPPGSPGQIGGLWCFVDGVMVQFAAAWSPAANAYMINSDWQGQPFMIVGDSNMPYHIDWIRVTQQ